MQSLTGLLGIAAFIGIAFALSEDRRRVDCRLVAAGLGLQFAFALLLLRVPGTADAFRHVAALVAGLLAKAEAGAAFVFGPRLTDPDGPAGFVFAFRVLPVIIFFASLMAILYHLRIMQLIIRGLAALLRRALGVTGVEAMAAAANVFVGQTEAPLCIRPFVAVLTRSQLMLVMTTGFATIAGSVLAAFVTYVGGDDPEARTDVATHLITASLISAPGAFVMAKLIIPETRTPVDASPDGPPASQQDEAAHKAPPIDLPAHANTLDAAAAGATTGLRLALNVGAMLLAFVALIAVIDWPLTALGQTLEARTAFEGELSLRRILGWLFYPAAFLIGIPQPDIAEIASLLGLSVVATEFLAYTGLGEIAAAGQIQDRSRVIATYALCGFANLPSIAIQIGGLSAIAPDRRGDIAALGFKAMLAGLLTCWTTACIAGLLI